VNGSWYKIQTAENCQTEKRGRNEIITVAKILLTNKMMLIIDCIFRPSIHPFNLEGKQQGQKWHETQVYLL